MTDWTAFAGVTGVVLGLLLALARLSQDTVSGFSDDLSSEQIPNTNSTPERVPSSTERLSPVTVLLNVGLSQGLFGVLLFAAVGFTAVPMAAIGIDTADPGSVGGVAVGVGIATGIGLYAINALGAVVATALGHDYDQRLREHLTPETTTGWVILLGGVLPIIAGFEELLFRGALIGALSTGFSISPWLLAGGSSIAFAVGHGAQGRIGVLVTGVLGFALAVVFVLTNSLLVVIIAHYLVNALEFLISGMLGIEWG
ncbi:CPBP family intramembrane glutamic endopeptidase [Halocatena pleomorpha]|uniref:CPBP family intramembrane metalloprotease n=1 Tax=Halocatena pleomorpha TaxID=1785090 RepID=A0A3P3R5Z2_9EURY|nr:type II CAAX endopeptidase family protein [Halocatena pleomorpha]RRJ28877.1 CPBP family intramembrane metalloprotease [Halocatena pleomorpha]